MRHHPRGMPAGCRRMIVGLLAMTWLTGCNAPEADSRRWVCAGRDAETQGNTDAAIIAYQQATRRDASNVAAHMALGDLLRQRGDYLAAGDAYARAADLEPLNFDAHYFFAMTRHLSGRFDDARKGYLLALAIRPEHVESNVNLAAVLVQLGKPDEAEPFARRATELAPGHAGAWGNLAAASAAGSTKADTAHQRAIRLAPDAAAPRMATIESHIAVGDFDGAAAALRDILRASPSAIAYERLGFCLFKLRRYPEALASFRESLRLDPGHVAALNGSGVTLLTLYVGARRTEPRTRDAGLDALRDSLAKNPDQPGIADIVSRYSRM